MKESNKALIFDIQRYSLHDGPGIRTILFLKGCPLKCLWCCNPESQSDKIQVEFYKDNCTGCGRCKQVCEQGAILTGENTYRIDRNKCIDCGKCVQACLNNALRTIGRWISVDEAVEQVKNDERYFRKSGGGLTLSGGEPLIWRNFCEEVLHRCYDLNINTAIETTGCVPRENLEAVIEYTDLFLYDIKSIDEERHIKLTDVSNKIIIDNIKYLRSKGKEVIMRIPLIPGCNFFKEELEQMMMLADETGIREVNIMPYHNLGEIKYERLAMNYDLKGVDSLKFADNLDEQIAEYNYIFEKYDNINVFY